MFDIGFSELLVVFVVALIILGPERLPTAAKTAGLWIRKIRRSINSVQREINAQLDQEELERKIEQTNQRILQESKAIQNTILPMDPVTSSNETGSASSAKETLSSTSDTAKQEATQVLSEYKQTASISEQETSNPTLVANKQPPTPDDIDPLTQDEKSSEKTAPESTRS